MFIERLQLQRLQDLLPITFITFITFNDEGLHATLTRRNRGKMDPSVLTELPLRLQCVIGAVCTWGIPTQPIEVSQDHKFNTSTSNATPKRIAKLSIAWQANKKPSWLTSRRSQGKNKKRMEILPADVLMSL
jgi:hypothetical protein